MTINVSPATIDSQPMICVAWADGIAAADIDIDIDHEHTDECKEDAFENRLAATLPKRSKGDPKPH